jgi:exonuclease I
MLFVQEWVHVAHDMFQDTIATIALENEVHVKKKVFHFFPCHTWRWKDVVITKDKFWTLMDVVITDLTHIDLVQCVLTMTTHGVTIVAHMAWSYAEQAPGGDFIPFAIETYIVSILVLIPFLFLVYMLV